MKDNRHQLMIECLVLEGMTPREVSMKFGMSEGRLSVLRKSPLWQIEERSLREEYFKHHRSRLESLIPKALDALEESVVSHNVVGEGTINERAVYNDPRVRISAAREILGRGGLSENVIVTNKEDIDKLSLFDTLEKIQSEKDKLKKELSL